MNVYVETNFVMEIVRAQEQSDSCEKIIQLSESNKIQLVIPAYSLVEPYETLIRDATNRRKLSEPLSKELKQLSRSKPYKDAVDDLQKITAFLVQIQEDEKAKLSQALSRILATAEVIPLNAEILRSAISYQTSHSLSPQDAIVYASVLDHLSNSTVALKCFLNRNSKDFDAPDIVDTLLKGGCKMLFNFDKGYDYISNKITPP